MSAGELLRAWAHSCPTGNEASDFVRVVEYVPHTLALVANAYDSGFSTRWPRGSRSLLESAVEAWAEGDGWLEARLVDAFDSAGYRFLDDACDYLQGHPDDFDTPAASMMIALVDADVVYLAWVGETCAVHVRDGVVIGRAKPSTLEHARRDIEFPEGMGDTLARLIRKGDHWRTSEKRFVLRPGDRFAMSTRPRAYSDWYADAASVLGSYADVGLAAEALVSERFVSKHGFVAACVLGFD